MKNRGDGMKIGISLLKRNKVFSVLVYDIELVDKMEALDKPYNPAIYETSLDNIDSLLDKPLREFIQDKIEV